MDDDINPALDGEILLFAAVIRQAALDARAGSEEAARFVRDHVGDRLFAQLVTNRPPLKESVCSSSAYYSR